MSSLLLFQPAAGRSVGSSRLVVGPQNKSKRALFEEAPPLPSEAVSWTTRVPFGVGGIAFALLHDIPALYLGPFLLEQIQITPVTLGNMMLASKVFDALMDPLVGMLTDRTNSRFGRRKPWMVGAMLLGIISNLLVWYSLPSDTTYTAKVAYYFAWMCTLALSVTCFIVPYAAFTLEVSMNDLQRVRLTEARMAFNFVGSLIGVVTVGAIVNVVFEGDKATGFFVANVVTTCLFSAAILAVVTFVRATHGKVLEAPKMSFGEEARWMLRALREILAQRAYLTLVSAATMTWMGLFLMQNNVYLYTQYCLRLPQYFTLNAVLALVSALVWVFVWRLVIRWRGKRQTWLLGQCGILGTFMLITFAPAETLSYMLCMTAFNGLAISNAVMLPWIMLPDVIDFDEYKTGERREGVATSMLVFFNKCAVGVAVALSSFILAAGGYDNSQGVPPYSESIDRHLRLIAGVIPACLVLCSIPIILAYPITPELHEDILIQVEDRRTKQVNETRPLLRKPPPRSRPHDAPPGEIAPQPLASVPSDTSEA